MKTLILVAAIFVAVSHVGAQSLSNETIQQRIRAAHAENSIALTVDEPNRVSKLMAVSENFAKDEAAKAGVLAMNFAVGYIYPGDSLVKSPETFVLTFWVLSKKPRFNASHAMTVVLSEEMLVVGSARYVAKAREQMEYLNYEVSREILMKIAKKSDVRFHLGNHEFTFTPSQMKLIADLLMITEAA